MSRNVSSWMRSADCNTSSDAAWWSLTSLLTSREALPIYLVVALFVLKQLPIVLELYSTRSWHSTASAYVVPAETRHARFLPARSRHAFHYKTLYVGVRLDQLEARNLDMGHAFAWKGAVLQPEFVNQSALAERPTVTPAGQRAACEQSDQERWKNRMRTAERIERKKLDEKRARNDRYTWSLTGLHPDAYLRTHIPIPVSDDAAEQKRKWISASILLKLAYELRERGYLTVGPQDSDSSAVRANHWTQELGHVWTVTMPSIGGITGINPLTVHYCYRPYGYRSNARRHAEPLRVKQDERRGVFWLVVLEVHNTFSERHIYVLEAGEREDEQTDAAPLRIATKRTRKGYDHQWTFPRSFHVSPFNDRGGYYRLFLKEPFANADESGKPSTFVLRIRLLLLVEAQRARSTNAPTLEKKLMATLDSISPAPLPTSSCKTQAHTIPPGRAVRPLSPATLYAALLRQPIDLFLTFARILYQAAKLHFGKRLDAFGRPDMVQSSEHTTEQTYDGVGLPPALNPIQPHRHASVGQAASRAAGLLYAPAGWTQVVAKEYVAGLLQRRVDELQIQCQQRWTVEVRSTDPADPGLHIAASLAEIGGEEKLLVLYTRSHSVYTDLMSYQPPRLALLLGSIVGRRWGVNSVQLFDQFFAHAQCLPTNGVRKRHLDLLLSPQADPRKAIEQLHSFAISCAPPSSTAQSASEGCKVWLALWIGLVAATAEKHVFGWLGARYVKGTEPWFELQRALQYIQAATQGDKDYKIAASWDTRLGSVCHV